MINAISGMRSTEISGADLVALKIIITFKVNKKIIICNGIK